MPPSAAARNDSRLRAAEVEPRAMTLQRSRVVSDPGVESIHAISSPALQRMFHRWPVNGPRMSGLCRFFSRFPFPLMGLER